MSKPDGTPRADRWKAYLWWLLLDNLVFLIAYPLCNWISAERGHTYGLYFAAELGLPFVPEFIWVYLSINLLFVWPPFLLGLDEIHALGRRILWGSLISCALFLIVPSHLGFERSLPAEPLYRAMFAVMFQADQPHNLVPSLHVVYSVITVLAYVSATSKAGLKLFWLFWLLLIVVSTVLVHQHHFIDIISGLILGAVLHLAVQSRPRACFVKLA
ncbi:MAG: phosphatase PAP2 family protein [Rhodocyclaceae bacterium]